MTEGACAKIIRDDIILFTRSPSVSHTLDSSLPEGADDMRCEHTEEILVVHLRTAREVGPYNRIWRVHTEGIFLVYFRGVKVPPPTTICGAVIRKKIFVDCKNNGVYRRTSRDTRHTI